MQRYKRFFEDYYYPIRYSQLKDAVHDILKDRDYGTVRGDKNIKLYMQN